MKRIIKSILILPLLVLVSCSQSKTVRVKADESVPLNPVAEERSFEYQGLTIKYFIIFTNANKDFILTSKDAYIYGTRGDSAQYLYLKNMNSEPYHVFGIAEDGSKNIIQSNYYSVNYLSFYIGIDSAFRIEQSEYYTGGDLNIGYINYIW